MATKKASNSFYGLGRRKGARARAYITPVKSGAKITVNYRDFEEYFPRPTSRMIIKQPLELVDALENFSINIIVKGGGSGTGQPGAIRLAIARALLAYDETLKPKLRADGMLTSDSRKVERKKFGRRKARKLEQYSKR